MRKSAFAIFWISIVAACFLLTGCGASVETPSATATVSATPTPRDILSQLTQNDNVKLLLSGTNDNARLNLIRNYMTTDLPSIGTLTADGRSLGLPAGNVRFGVNEGFSLDRTGKGFVLIAVDGGLITKQDGTTAELLLLPVNQKDPVHSAWYALFISPDPRLNFKGDEISISSSGSHTTLAGKSVEPDQFMADEQGRLVAVGFVTDGYKGDKYIGPFPTSVAEANAKLGTWIMNPHGETPTSVVLGSSLNNDTISSIVPATYVELDGF